MLQTGAAVAGVGLIGPEDARFASGIEALLGRAPDQVLRPALPYSVVVQNDAARAVALLGVRFDMENRDGKRYAVVHYADSLRYPENADLIPGRLRFFCAEPLYTNLVLRRDRQVDARGPMNLANLLHAREMRASVDCVAFVDGEFSGPDTNGAFDRLAHERAAEEELVAAVLREGSEAGVVTLCEAVLGKAAAAKLLARSILTELVGGGLRDAERAGRHHRYRIPLRRA